MTQYAKIQGGLIANFGNVLCQTLLWTFSYVFTFLCFF